MTPDRLKDALHAGIPGCLWIIRFDAQGRAGPGRAEDLDALGSAREGFVWLHMDLTDVRARPQIARIAALSDSAREALCDPLDHQYLEYSEGLVSGALLDHERTLAGPAWRTDYLRFAIGESFAVTARRSPMNSVEAARGAIGRGMAIESPLALFELMATCLVDELSRMTNDIGAAFDRAEDLIIDGSGRKARPMLGAGRRDAVRLSRQVGGLVSTLARLEDIEDDPEDARDNELREVAARLVQHTESLGRDMQALQDRARLLQDELNAILNLETNDRLYVLTVVTTLLLPATFVTGFFGMNLKNLPFSESEEGVAYATVVCVVAAGAILLLMRRWGLTAAQEDEESRPRASSPSRPADGGY
ncbi:CorA family divalent cation transporter [Methylocystis parvus]|uniref:Magnesium transporter CorA n=1 Tax=Methylocystis parvus TaxID=134 RepID=A0A6B8M3T7_9HYPH|nr:CorA family divalent cation transporter [Methylocystis parvus]QGM97015.1 magnesium transporter CorA [Methylocystis parvus]WBJ99089.1 magnesium transporter CorA [Methylocystis parvus OBBP]